MFVFIISQLIGLCLFITLNYGLLSYIQYRKNQVAGKAENRMEWIFLQNVRVGFYIFLIFGVFNRLSSIGQSLNLDYSFIILRALFSIQEVSLLPI